MKKILEDSCLLNMMNRRVILILSFALLSPLAWAEEEDEEEEEYIVSPYGHNNTLELSLGPTTNLYQDNNHLTNGYMGNNQCGPDFQIRYTHFLEKQWGWFVSAEISTIKCYPANTESIYDYEYNYRYADRSYCLESPYFKNRYYQALTGATYRYDFGKRFSLRGRLGIGYRYTDLQQYYNYARWDAHLTQNEMKYSYQSRPDDFEEIRIRPCNKEGHSIDFRGTGVISPSIQICFTPRKHMFFAFEAQWTATLNSVHLQVDRYDVHQTVSDLPEDAIWETPTDLSDYCENEDVRVYDNESKTYKQLHFDRKLRSTEHHRTSLGNYLSFRFGVGWNLK